jgi:transcriptional regulator with XRE-family HTH domain
VYLDRVTAQQISTDLNKQIGANLQRYRKASGISQGGLAQELTRRGYPTQQQTVLKIEKGARPLRADELATIAEILEVPPAALLDYYTDAGERAAATAQLEHALANIATRREKRAELDREIERYELNKRDAERRLAALEDGVNGDR